MIWNSLVEFLQFNNLVNPRPLKIFGWYNYALWFLLGLSFLALVIRLYGSFKFSQVKPKWEFLKKITRETFILIVVGAVLVFSRRIGVAYLSSSVWVLAWIFILFSFIGYWYSDYKFHLPRRVEQFEKQQVKKKYLPKRKK